MDPLISIVIPNYNKGVFAEDCINSVIEQSFRNWEMIFIDDGSTDGSFDRAKEIAQNDTRIRVLRNESGIKGANKCRNIGIDLAKSEYLIFFDSDDLMSTDCLQERVYDLSNLKDEAILVHQTGMFYKELYDSDLVINIPKEKSFLDRFLLRDVVWLTSGPLWPKHVIKSLEGFDESLHSFQEYDLHVRAFIRKYDFRFFNKAPKLFNRREVESESRKNSQTVAHFKSRVNMIMNHYHLMMEEDVVNEERKRFIAISILDIAQMMRWHKIELGKESLKYGVQIWTDLRTLSIISADVYRKGLLYIHFKHQMLFNRVPWVQSPLERYFRKILKPYIFTPSTTFCQSKLSASE